MTLVHDLGELLITIDNAVKKVFGDRACITHITPSSRYEERGTIVDITIEVLKDKYPEDLYEKRIELFYDVIGTFPESLLMKVGISVVDCG